MSCAFDQSFNEFGDEGRLDIEALRFTSVASFPLSNLVTYLATNPSQLLVADNVREVLCEIHQLMTCLTPRHARLASRLLIEAEKNI